MSPIKNLTKIIGKLITAGFEPFGKYYSTYKGIVVDNRDAEGLQRLKVVIPEVFKFNTYYRWVYPQSVFAGKGYGAHVIPQIGDIVSITFDYGDRKNARWSHGYFNKQDVKSISKYLDPKQFWFRTPRGLMVLLDDSASKDEPEKISIELIHPKGNRIKIDGESISLSADDGKHINLGSIDNAAEYILKGETLLGYLKDLTNACAQLTVNTAGVPSTPPINVADFLVIREKLDLSLSNKVKSD